MSIVIIPKFDVVLPRYEMLHGYSIRDKKTGDIEFIGDKENAQAKLNNLNNEHYEQLGCVKIPPGKSVLEWLKENAAQQGNAADAEQGHLWV